MKGPNLSAWALSHRGMMRFLIVVAALAGIYAYGALGRQEDPDYTIKTMLITAAWPGADAAQMAEQVGAPIERTVRTLAEVDSILTSARPGVVVITVKLHDDVSPAAIASTWTRIRQRVSDHRPELPKDLQGPEFNDDLGQTYGNVYALTGDGFSLTQLNGFAEALRDKVRTLPDVGRADITGAVDERIYIEYSGAKLALLGVDPQQIVQTVQATNVISPAGEINLGGERVRIAVSGSFGSVEAIREMRMAVGGRSLRLGDVATVTRGLADPPGFRMRFNGEDAVGLLVSLRGGGDSNRLGKDLSRLVASFQAQAPVGVSIGPVADQPRIVRESIGEFSRSLVEAVAIVLGVSFLALGRRPGIVVALCIPIVLALTFAGMLLMGIPLHRVSLGALIIALGLLVDDAIIVVEQIETNLKSGWDKVRAVTSAYEVTAQPMLIGTLITAAGFLPIGLAQSSTGEYTRSIFQVVAISLGLSWLVAVFITPFLANWLLPAPTAPARPAADPGSAHCDTYQSPFYQRFRGAVTWALDQRRTVLAITAGLFVGSLVLFGVAVPKQFFPTSDRPELLVELRLTENTSFEQTSAVARRMEAALKGDADIISTATYVGGGTPRFYLALATVNASQATAQIVINTRGGRGRERVRQKIEGLLSARFPEAQGRVSTLELGPAVGQPLQIRITGDQFSAIAPAAEQLEALMHGDPRVRDVNKDYGEPLKSVRILLDQNKARAMGVTTLSVQQGLQSAISGALVTTYREGDDAILVMARLEASERNSIDRLAYAQVKTATGESVPISQVAHLQPTFQPAELNLRDGRPTITVLADVVGGQPADVVTDWKPSLQAINDSLPDGAALEFGGALEGGSKAQASVFKALPIAVLVILLLLMIQLQSSKKMLLIVLTGPLALIGVALILSTMRVPFGFVALLGSLALFGMVIRNSVILVSQITLLEQEGRQPFEAIVEATVHRFRPITLTALAAILAMIPLTRSVFWGPMAWSIMGGLVVATQLTLFFLPALYAAAYNVRRELAPAEDARA
jgi:multidrug efflux pump